MFQLIKCVETNKRVNMVGMSGDVMFFAHLHRVVFFIELRIHPWINLKASRQIRYEEQFGR